jgi:hypothetical protein
MVEALVIVAGVGVWLAVALYDARTHPPAASANEDEGEEARGG